MNGKPIKKSLKSQAKTGHSRENKVADMVTKHVSVALQGIGLKAALRKETALLEGSQSLPPAKPIKVVGESHSLKPNTFSSKRIESFASVPTSLPIMELPQYYGITRIVLLIRDPHWAYAYWEISDEAKIKIMKSTGTHDWKQNKQLLRIYEVPGSEQNAGNARQVLDVEMDENASNWYILMPQPGRAYMVEIGVSCLNGTFHKIARSNKVYMPRNWVSLKVDDQWTAPQYEEIARMSGGGASNPGGFGSASCYRRDSPQAEE